MSARTVRFAAFDSAYPGSMFERDHGEFVGRGDNDSLAFALLDNIEKLRRDVEDWRDAAIAMERQRDELALELEHAARWFDQLKPEDAERYRAAIAKTTGAVAPFANPGFIPPDLAEKVK